MRTEKSFAWYVKSNWIWPQSYCSHGGGHQTGLTFYSEREKGVSRYIFQFWLNLCTD